MKELGSLLTFLFLVGVVFTFFIRLDAQNRKEMCQNVYPKVYKLETNWSEELHICMFTLKNGTVVSRWTYERGGFER